MCGTRKSVQFSMGYELGKAKGDIYWHDIQRYQLGDRDWIEGLEGMEARNDPPPERSNM